MLKAHLEDYALSMHSNAQGSNSDFVFVYNSDFKVV